MAKNFKYEYKQHIRNTAPDMDKLWDKIESEIDNKNSRREKITHTSNTDMKIQIKRICAIASAIVVVIVGARLWKASNQPETTKTDLNPNSTNSVYETDSIAEEDNESSYSQETVSYNSLALNATDTVAYKENYQASGDDYFVEENVLAQTEYFADVTVLTAELKADGAEYTLIVNRFFTSDGEEKEITDITIYSSTPYILQQNREYFIPLKQEDGKWYIVFENAPQIEITLDGGAVFQNGWNSLEKNSKTVDKEELNKNDFYYDRMEYCDEMDLQNLIDKWKDT